VYENEPLSKLLVDQLCGRGDASRKRGFRAMSGCAGFRELDWDDAAQAGLLALQKALEQFDPSKGKFAPYCKMKLRHELQRLVFYGGTLIRVPRGNGVDPIGVALVGEQQDLDMMSGGYEDGVAATEGITPEMVADWERTGEWPESLEELRASLREDEPDEEDETAPAVVPSLIVPTDPIELFMLRHLEFRRHARTPISAIVGRFESLIWPRQITEIGPLRQAIMARGATAHRMRTEWSSSAEALRGVLLRPTSQVVAASPNP
jgi:hypothetical protein